MSTMDNIYQHIFATCLKAEKQTKIVELKSEELNS